MRKKLSIISLLLLFWVSPHALSGDRPASSIGTFYPKGSAMHVFGVGSKFSCGVSIILAAERGSQFILTSSFEEHFAKIQTAYDKAHAQMKRTERSWLGNKIRGEMPEHQQAKAWVYRWNVRGEQGGIAFDLADRLYNLDIYAADVVNQYATQLATNPDAREAFEDLLNIGGAHADRLDAAFRTLAYSVDKELNDEILILFDDEKIRYVNAFAEMAADQDRLALEIENLERRLSGGRNEIWARYEKIDQIQQQRIEAGIVGLAQLAN